MNGTRSLNWSYGFRRIAYALVSLLKACSELKDVQQGLHIHMKALQTGSLNTNPFVASSLIIMYAKCSLVNGHYQHLRCMSPQNINLVCVCAHASTHM